jgi:hypothetical protein
VEHREHLIQASNIKDPRGERTTMSDPERTMLFLGFAVCFQEHV